MPCALFSCSLALASHFFMEPSCSTHCSYVYLIALSMLNLCGTPIICMAMKTLEIGSHRAYNASSTRILFFHLCCFLFFFLEFSAFTRRSHPSPAPFKSLSARLFLSPHFEPQASCLTCPLSFSSGRHFIPHRLGHLV